MKKTTPIYCYYFSGTGNTKSLVEHFATYMKNNGFTVIVKEIKKGTTIDEHADFTLGIMFPVAIQFTFPLVKDFIKRLPQANNREVFMFDTMQDFSGGVVGPLKKMLSKKGYNCIGAKEFKMSSSINTNAQKIIKGEEKNKNALKQVENFAHDLIEGKTQWKRIPILSDIMYASSLPKAMWILTSKALSITDECILCLKCQKNCPTDAMYIKGNKMAINHTTCITCMKCASLCPTKAILFGKKRLQLSKQEKAY